MATNKHAIIRYETLDRCFSNRGRRFFMDDLILCVSEALRDYTGADSSISRRQIFKDIDFMRSEGGFRAPIESYKDGKKAYYRYSDPNYSLAMQQLNPVEAELLKTALDMLGRFKGLPKFDFIEELSFKLKKSLKLEDLDECIFFDHNEYLKNLDLLGPLIDHTQRRQVLTVTYQPFNQDTEEQFIIHPYFLKQYNKRWFLYGQREEYDTWTNLALDRIISIEVAKDQMFIPPIETHDNYFEDIIGVSKPEGIECTQIELHIAKRLWPYIDSKPIHPSQKVLSRTAEYVAIQLEIIPNYEFYSQILGFGYSVEIISPLSVREEIKNHLINSMNNYAPKSLSL